MALVMGIDPGEQTGVAIYRGGHLAELFTVSPAKYMSVLCEYSPALLVIEDSRLQSHVFTGPQETSKVRLKIARNIGMVDGFCSILTRLAETLEIPMIGVSPLGKGAKINAAQLATITGWTGKSNQHERDASAVAHQYRNWSKTQ
jgi:hypothetical protein